MTQSVITTATITISSGGTTSPEFEIPQGYTLTGINTPAAVTGTTLKISAASTAGGTSNNLTDGIGNDITLTLAASKFLGVNPDIHRTWGLKYIKLISGAAEAADRIFTITLSRL